VHQPWKTQQLIDQVFEEQYFASPEGLSGNEDCGQMSAWLVMNAMGFYQVAPGNPTYSIGRPLFEKIVINLPNGKKFTVSVGNFAKTNRYIASATLNGKQLDTPFFTHADLVNGGELHLEMTDKPTDWGTR
jgi:putative alpha-1,2-mannosidase